MKQELLEEAADWYDRRNELSTNEQSKFLRWLQDDEHRIAYEKISRCMNSQALNEALKAQTCKKEVRGQTNIHPFKRVPLITKYRLVAASIALFCITSIIFVNSVSLRDKTQNKNPLVAANLSRDLIEVYSTDTAERNARVLTDGSEVLLNASSSLKFKSTVDQRHATLNDGQVMFDVAHEERPFVIGIGSSQVEVLGTVFDIDRNGSNVTINVYEGLVSVTADRSIKLRKGERVNITNDILGHVQRHNDIAPSWDKGWLEVEGEPLSDVIAKFQRYIRKPLILNMAIPADHIVNGRFDLDSPVASLQLLARVSDLELNVNEKSIRISERDESQ